MTRGSPRLTAAAAVCLGLLCVGCRDKVKDISNSSHLLDMQHKLWEKTRQTLESSQPNLQYVPAVYKYLRIRTRRRVEKDYTGSNKQQVLAALDAIRKRYESEILSKV
ncbi:hypothetical protein LCGC14_1685790, partial [marine sediment metagenome]